MLRLFSLAATALVTSIILGCKSGHSVLTLSELPNYDTCLSDQILFLNFRITGAAVGGEQVELSSANVGAGKMKDISRPVDFPYQIKAIPRYSTGAIERQMVFEHPLYRQVEVSDPTGHIRQAEAKAIEGNVLIRLQKHPGLNQLELLSVSPEKGTVKIYTLNFK